MASSTTTLKGFSFFFNYWLQQIQSALTELRSKIKQEARIIIKQDYHLHTVPESLQDSYNRKEITLVEIVKNNVEELMCGSQESDMPFTKGPRDQQVSW